ncbi:MAG: hypothetical protein MZV70_69055 [Desulfobacterales bacterium]|nr:hypothetical protein [Desulfobacterales bacterium]
MKRRRFLSIAGAAASIGFSVPEVLAERQPSVAGPNDVSSASPSHPNQGGRPLVDFSVDGLGLTPREYAAELAALAEGNSVEADYYSLGGTVAELEKRFAALLGKERGPIRSDRHAGKSSGCPEAGRARPAGARSGRKPPFQRLGRLRDPSERPDPDSSGGRPKHVHGR